MTPWLNSKLNKKITHVQPFCQRVSSVGSFPIGRSSHVIGGITTPSFEHLITSSKCGGQMALPINFPQNAQYRGNGTA